MFLETKRTFKESRCRLLEGNIFTEVLIQLKRDELLIQKKEYPKNASIASTLLSNKTRKVVVCRNSGRGLGISIKGGAEHGLPILVSKILNRDFGVGEDSLHVGDAILEVNGENVQSMSHGEVVHLLRCAGDRVEMKVKFYQPAFQYLTLQRDSLTYSSLVGSDDAKELTENSLEVFEKRWTTFVKVPLAGGYATKRSGEDGNELANTLLLVNGSQTVKLQFDDHETFSGWMMDLRKRICEATKTFVLQININLPVENQINHAVWVYEKQGENEMARPMNISLVGDSIFLSDRLNLNDWNSNKTSFKIYEYLMLKTGKRCLVMKHIKSQAKVFFFNSNFDYIEFLKAWLTCNYSAVSELKVKTFEVSFAENPGYFSLEFDPSIIFLQKSESKEILWTHKLSQIKECRKLNNSRILLELWNETGTAFDRKVITCPDAFEILCYLNTFIAAKLASLDPMFLLQL